MALFGSTWTEDSDEIGPFSHWNEDEDVEINEDLPQIDLYEGSIFNRFKDE